MKYRLKTNQHPHTTEVLMKKLGYLLSVAKDGRFWVRGHSRYLLDNLIHRGKNAATGYSDDDHLNAAAHWLESAQDATLDGGVVGRYRLKVGWTSSYPETTGYIIPTFLALAKDLNQERYIERARRAVTFLLGIQLENGAFPGLEIAENRHVPSPFNTGQIINGLVAWAVATDDKMALAAARRAGDWLISIQDEDGAWRKHYYNGVVSTYAAHIACWLAQLGQCGGDGKYLCAESPILYREVVDLDRTPENVEHTVGVVSVDDGAARTGTLDDNVAGEVEVARRRSILARADNGEDIRPGGNNDRVTSTAGRAGIDDGVGVGGTHGFAQRTQAIPSDRIGCRGDRDRRRVGGSGRVGHYQGDERECNERDGRHRAEGGPHSRSETVAPLHPVGGLRGCGYCLISGHDRTSEGHGHQITARFQSPVSET